MTLWLIALWWVESGFATGSPSPSPPPERRPPPSLAHPSPPSHPSDHIPPDDSGTAPERGEPTVAALCRAAAALSFVEPERAQSLLARARRAGWLPELRVRVDRRFDRNEALDFGRAPLDAPPPPLSLGTSDDVRYEWRVTWDLSRIIFNPDEVPAQNQALRMADARREIVGVVIRLYYERQRLKAEAVTSDASDSATRLHTRLRVLEIEAELDSLTAGVFSRALEP